MLRKELGAIVNNKLLLGIGREYTVSEKREIKKFAVENGYNVGTCKAGIYYKITQ